MADPISIAASVAGVVSAGVKIAAGLYTIVDTVKNAPKELHYMAQQIEHLSELFSCTFQLIEERETLYQERLTLMIRDVRWQFKIIQDVVETCLTGGKTRARFRFLFKAKLVGDLLRKLEALKSTMMLTLQITQLAASEVSVSAGRCYRYIADSVLAGGIASLKKNKLQVSMALLWRLSDVAGGR